MNLMGRKLHMRRLLFRVLKAALKGLVVGIILFLLSTFMLPFDTVVPGSKQVFDIFTITFIAFIVLAELLSGTIFQHIVNIARSFFLIAYLAFAFKNGIIAGNVSGVNFTVDLTLFVSIFILLSLLGLARNMLQVVGFLTEKVEQTTFQ